MNSYSLIDDINLVVGKHQLVFGGEYIRVQENINNSFSANGNFTFSSTFSNKGPGGISTGGTGGDSNLDFLTGSLQDYKQSKAQQNALRAPYVPQPAPGVDDQNNFLLDRPRAGEAVPAAAMPPAAYGAQSTTGSQVLWSYSDKEMREAVPVPQEPDTGERLLNTPPERQFIPPPLARGGEAKKAGNPHPSRSLWHYTDKYPIVKGGR